MMAGIGVLLFAGMTAAGCFHCSGMGFIYGVFIIAAIVIICLPFLAVAIAGKGKPREASSAHADADV